MQLYIEGVVRHTIVAKREQEEKNEGNERGGRVDE